MKDFKQEPCVICGVPSNNGTYCSPHIDEYRKYRQAQQKDREATMKSIYKYYIPYETDFGSGDSPMWTGYTAHGKGNTIQEFLDSVEWAETDQDGGTMSYGGFDDCPFSSDILSAVGLNWDEIEYK
jgi:hypothetical protein